MIMDFDELKSILMDYFDIGNDTCFYYLTRVKEAFEIGTMSFNDFEELNEDTIDDLISYIKSHYTYKKEKNGKINRKG
jgi:hypothetical protein